MTRVLRASSMRAVIICKPLVNTKAAVKKSAAPITGSGRPEPAYQAKIKPIPNIGRRRRRCERRKRLPRPILQIFKRRLFVAKLSARAGQIALVA